MTTDTSGLHQLGHMIAAPTSPETAELERVPNPHAGTLYLTRFTAPEFTSLCPVTGQPDFAHIVIDYAPGDWLVESKSLKLYLGSYRNHGEFHEACVNRIANDLVRLLDPVWLVVEGRFTARGGIPFWPVAVYRRELRDAGAVSDEGVREQPDLFDLLEPVTADLDRAPRREEAI